MPSAARARRIGRPAPAGQHRQLAHVAAAALGVVIAGSLAYGLFHAQASGQPKPSTSAAARAAAARGNVAAWVARQVGRSLTVSCDPQMCLGLQQRGVPSGSLREFRPGQGAPPHATLIIATALVRRELGARLAASYAPEVIASFGAGSSRIDVRTMSTRGATALRARLASDLQQRRESGAELLTSDRIVVSATARKQLLAGHVDPRLLVTIAGFAALSPVHIVAFGDPAPGASADVSPLRTAELAALPGESRSASSAFVHALLSFLRVQRAPFAVSGEQVVHLASGDTAVRIGYPAPSPLGLLGAGGGAR